MINFKQMFCSHIYRTLSEEYLGIENDGIDPTMGGGYDFHTFCQEKECVKCGKIDYVTRCRMQF